MNSRVEKQQHLEMFEQPAKKKKKITGLLVIGQTFDVVIKTGAAEPTWFTSSFSANAPCLFTTCRWFIQTLLQAKLFTEEQLSVPLAVLSQMRKG